MIWHTYDCERFYVMASPDNRTTPWTYVLDEPLRILVVDDDPILREFASVYLATPSATIETACDGVAARTRLGQVGYDLLLLDIEMPQLDGLSLLEEIRSDESLKHLPVIMLTGHDDIASIDRAYQLGANSFATKPVNWRQLSYQIRYVIRTTRAEGLQAGPHDPLQEPDLGPTPTATERDVRDFLQSVIHRADALKQQLPAHDCVQLLEQLSNIRLFAKRAISEYSREARSSGADCARHAEVIDQLAVGKADQPLADRKSVNVMELQS
jgi:DNA-binding response OmpR family regulator